MPHRYAHDNRKAPDWKSRSTVTLAPGRWKMRNGQIAIVKKLLEIPYVEQATGKPKKYPVWLGRCECCKSSMSWNANGTHAPFGRHPFDIIKGAGNGK